MSEAAAASATEPSRRFETHVALCLIADGGSFVSRPVDALTVDFTGIVGDKHAGRTRLSTSREPWYPRGTEVRNDRQLTIVSSVELAEVAEAMDLPAIQPGWIGANLVFADIPRLTFLPAGTKLFFAGGAGVNIEAENAPCRVSGRSIGTHYSDRGGARPSLSQARSAQARPHRIGREAGNDQVRRESQAFGAGAAPLPGFAYLTRHAGHARDGRRSPL
jgi:hypothetical protein